MSVFSNSRLSIGMNCIRKVELGREFIPTWFCLFPFFNFQIVSRINIFLICFYFCIFDVCFPNFISFPLIFTLQKKKKIWQNIAEKSLVFVSNLFSKLLLIFLKLPKDYILVIIIWFYFLIIFLTPDPSVHFNCFVLFLFFILFLVFEQNIRKFVEQTMISPLRMLRQIWFNRFKTKIITPVMWLNKL